MAGFHWNYFCRQLHLMRTGDGVRFAAAVQVVIESAGDGGGQDGPVAAAALAGQPQDPVAAVISEVPDVAAEGLFDPQARPEMLTSR
jgi:hypothetical protein